MEKVVADLVLPHLHKLIKKKCFGCKNGCLSQTDHDCLTDDYKLQVLLYLEEAMKNVRMEDIIAKMKEDDTFCTFQKRIYQD